MTRQAHTSSLLNVSQERTYLYVVKANDGEGTGQSTDQHGTERLHHKVGGGTDSHTSGQRRILHMDLHKSRDGFINSNPQTKDKTMDISKSLKNLPGVWLQSK